MNIKNIEIYKRLFWVRNPEVLSDEEMEALVMVDSNNYNVFLSDIGESVADVEEVNNVSLVEFDKEKDMHHYLKGVNQYSLVGFSLEHDVPCVLHLI